MKHTALFPAGALRRAGAALCLALALPLTAAAQQLPPARQVLDRYVEAMGGREAISRQKFRTMDTEMSMPAMGMNMTVKTVAAAPDRMVTTAEMPGAGAIRSGYDGSVGWQVNPMTGPSLLSGAELEQSAQMADFHAPLNYDKQYRSMETTERTELNGRPCYRVKLTTASGRESWQCFDTETGLMVATGGKQESQMGSIEVTSLLSDYREFDGVKMPTRSTTKMMGQDMTATVKSVSHAPVDAAVFALPAEIQVLAGARKP
ncbi:MAG TPA: hypothetical protein VGV85_00930 [Longimicrobiaceae bacterium]|nr:hypothetical protein [Longimicrobiaceae bacterium]